MKNKSMIRGTPARCMSKLPSFLAFKAGQYVEERFGQHFASLPLKARHFCVLRVLDNSSGSLSQQELCEALWIDRATMTGVIQLLKKLGFVTRSDSKEDKRRVLVALTERGKKFYLENIKGFEELERDIYSALDAKEIDQLKQLLDKLLRAIANR